MQCSECKRTFAFIDDLRKHIKIFYMSKLDGNYSGAVYLLQKELQCQAGHDAFKNTENKTVKTHFYILYVFI